MKKLFFPLFLCLLLAACASKPEPAEKKVDKPVIEIKYTGSSALVSFSYRGDDWLFITGVEVMNGAGDIKRCMIKNPTRRVWSGGRVSEVGVFSAANADEFKAWLGDNPRARVVCDYPQSYEAVEILISAE